MCADVRTLPIEHPQVIGIGGSGAPAKLRCRRFRLRKRRRGFAALAAGT
jgi:hypothetical protein